MARRSSEQVFESVCENVVASEEAEDLALELVGENREGPKSPSPLVNLSTLFLTETMPDEMKKLIIERYLENARCSCRALARCMGVSPATVKTWVTSISALDRNRRAALLLGLVYGTNPVVTAARYSLPDDLISVDEFGSRYPNVLLEFVALGRCIRSCFQWVVRDDHERGGLLKLEEQRLQAAESRARSIETIERWLQRASDTQLLHVAKLIETLMRERGTWYDGAPEDGLSDNVQDL